MPKRKKMATHLPTLHQLNDVAGGLYLEFHEFKNPKEYTEYSKKFFKSHAKTRHMQDHRTDKPITVFANFDHKEIISFYDYTTGRSAKNLTAKVFCERFPDLAPLAARLANYSIDKIRNYPIDHKHINCETDVKVLKEISDFVESQPNLNRQLQEIEHKSAVHKRSREERDTAHYFQSTRDVRTPNPAEATKGKTEAADQSSSPLAACTASVAGPYNPLIATQPKPEAPKVPPPYRPPMSGRPKTTDAVSHLTDSAAALTGVEPLIEPMPVPKVATSSSTQTNVTLSLHIPPSLVPKICEYVNKLKREHSESTSISSSSASPANKRPCISSTEERKNQEKPELDFPSVHFSSNHHHPKHHKDRSYHHSRHHHRH